MTDWVLKDEQFKAILSKHDDTENELQSVEDTKAELIPHLRNTPGWRRLPGGIIQQLKSATTFHTFNRVLNLLYDYADEHRIWLGL